METKLRILNRAIMFYDSRCYNFATCLPRKKSFENLINNEGLTTFHKAGTAFYLLKLKIESQGLFDQGYFLCYKYQILPKKSNLKIR